MKVHKALRTVLNVLFCFSTHKIDKSYPTYLQDSRDEPSPIQDEAKVGLQLFIWELIQ